MFAFISFVLEVTAREIKQEKNSWIQIGKKEAKLSLFANGMILYRENAKEYASLLGLINELDKLPDTRSAIPNWLDFCYTRNEQSKMKLRKQFYVQKHKTEYNT